MYTVDMLQNFSQLQQNPIIHHIQCFSPAVSAPVATLCFTILHFTPSQSTDASDRLFDTKKSITIEIKRQGLNTPPPACSL